MDDLSHVIINKTKVLLSIAKIIYVCERRTLVLLIITWLISPMSERGEP
jgi:hypothetical protein